MSGSLSRPTHLESCRSAAVDRQIRQRPIHGRHRPDRPLGQVSDDHRGQLVNLAVKGQLAPTEDDHHQHLDLVVAVRLDAITPAEPDQVGLQVLPVQPPPRPGMAPASCEAGQVDRRIGSGMPPSCHPRPSSPERAKRGPGTACWVLGRVDKASGTARGPKRDLAVPTKDGGTAAVGSWNGLAGGADAASGPLHPDADRPLSRPPGRSHAAPGPRQGRVASLRDRLRRPLTWPGRRGPASTPPPGGGRSQAGRPRAPSTG
jgi:hypothetical protein